MLDARVDERSRDEERMERLQENMERLQDIAERLANLQEGMARKAISSDKDPLESFIGAVSHGSLAQNLEP
jgi:hypothetical protein